ncbi:MAG: AAA family ATPase [Pseudomonadota bacterium]
MDYFSVLNLNKEPFSNSPDPEYFFQSRQHHSCLQKIELSLRLRRGLNVVIGDVGTGKTTLCRQLIRKFSGDKESETFLILDPSFRSASEFLNAISEMFEGDKLPGGADDWQVKEAIKRYIFRKGVDEKKTVILIIDEGQKIPDFCLEILREFLNYETNEYKLLQIVIFAQSEFERTLEQYHNFADRINLFHFLGPLGFKDTRLMIRFRVRQSGGGATDPDLFTYLALRAIYRATGGYPRKIINLCHQCMLAMIIQNRTKVGWPLVRSCVQRSVYREPGRFRRSSAVALTGVLAVALAVGFTSGSLKVPETWEGLMPKSTRFHGTSYSVNTPTAPIEKKAEKIRVETPRVHMLPAEKAPLSSVESQAPSPAIEETRDTDPPEQKGPTEPETDEPAAAGPHMDAPQSESVETAANDPDTPVQTYRFPLMLGQVALKNNETLWRLIEKVYGVYSDEHLKRLMQANSHITNPDHTEVGQIISVPAIPAKVAPPATAVWWVSVGEKDTLDAAIDLLRRYPENAPPIRIVPHWDSLHGLNFTLLFTVHYVDEVSARDQLEKLAPSMAAEGRIVSFWDEGTIFFSDPYLK